MDYNWIISEVAAHAYHVTSDMYPDWLIKAVALRHISAIEPLQCTIVYTGDYNCLGEVNILVNITPLLPKIQW
jgi:hypothetical protein